MSRCYVKQNPDNVLPDHYLPNNGNNSVMLTCPDNHMGYGRVAYWVKALRLELKVYQFKLH